MKAVCGWAKPTFSQSRGVTVCGSCHGTLRFDLHINQWVHDRSSRPGNPDGSAS